MWLTCLADDSHKMSRLIFYEKKKKKEKQYFKLLSAAVLIGTLRVKLNKVEKTTREFILYSI